MWPLVSRLIDASLTGRAGTGKVVCVVSGGNIDAGKLTAILRGELPEHRSRPLIESTRDPEDGLR